LAYFGGLTHSEIARELDIPMGTVKTRLRLAFDKLRTALSPIRDWVG
jgi:RNA polymerase sigma-70 factor, ECF subfamily